MAGLLGLAAFLRLWQLDLAQYREDDDELWGIVTHAAQSMQVPLTGMHSSLGLPNGPFQALLLLPFGWVGAGPALMTAGVALLNVLAAALVYGFSREFFGRRVALLALALVAVNPWAVVLSRRLWGDDMLAPFAVLALWMLCRWLAGRGGWALVVASAALAVGAQVYIVGLELLAPAAVAILAGRQRLLTRWTPLAVLVFALLIGPYAVGAALPRLQVLGGMSVAPGQAPRVDLASAAYALELASAEGYQSFALQGGAHLDATSGIAGALGTAGRLAYAVGLLLGLWTLLRGPGRLWEAPRVVHLLVLVAVATPVLVLLRHSVPVYPYYLVATFPAPYLYAAFSLDRLWSLAGRFSGWPGRSVRGLLATFIGATIALDLVLAVLFFAVIGEYWPGSIYGMPWRMTDHLVRETMQLQRQYGAPRAVVAQHNQELRVLYRVLRRRGADASEVDDQRMTVLPAQPSISLAIGDAPAQRFMADRFGRYLVHEERLAGQGIVARWYLLPAALAAAPLPAGVEPMGWTFAERGRPLVRLDGVSAPERVAAGQTVTLTAYYTPLRTGDATVPDYSLFAHLLNASGSTVAQQDAAAWESSNWRTGDRVIQWLPLTVPANTAGVLPTALGMYSTGTPDQPAIQPLDARDAAGRDLGSQGPGPLLVAPPPAPPAPQVALHVAFASGAVLQGYDLTGSRASLTVTLHWLATADLRSDATVFVHLLEGTGRLVAQHDGPALGGRFPTSVWRAGDAFADPHVIALPAVLPPGPYRLEVGLYDPRTLQRVPVTAGQPLFTVQLPLR